MNGICQGNGKKNENCIGKVNVGTHFWERERESSSSAFSTV